MVQVERDVDLVADKTGMKRWMVVGLIALVIVVAVAGIAFCTYRFFR